RTCPDNIRDRPDEQGLGRLHHRMSTSLVHPTAMMLAIVLAAEPTAKAQGAAASPDTSWGRYCGSQQSNGDRYSISLPPSAQFLPPVPAPPGGDIYGLMYALLPGEPGPRMEVHLHTGGCPPEFSASANAMAARGHTLQGEEDPEGWDIRVEVDSLSSGSAGGG